MRPLVRRLRSQCGTPGRSLYLPVGVDPHGDICGVVFAHPYPQSKEVLSQRIIRNNNLQDMLWLIETGDRLATPFQAQPVYIFEATNVFWRAQRNFLHRAGYATATVCGRQTNHARGTVTRAAKNDLKDAYNITKVFKQGESHATRILPEPLASFASTAACTSSSPATPWHPKSHALPALPDASRVRRPL